MPPIYLKTIVMTKRHMEMGDFVSQKRLQAGKQKSAFYLYAMEKITL